MIIPFHFIKNFKERVAAPLFCARRSGGRVCKRGTQSCLAVRAPVFYQINNTNVFLILVVEVPQTAVVAFGRDGTAVDGFGGTKFYI